MQTKIKSCGDEATDFHNEEIPKTGSDYTCLAVINFDSALKKDENCYSQLFLKECKHIEKEVIKYITEDIDISFDYSDKFDEEQINRLEYFFKKASSRKKHMVFFVFSLLYNPTIFFGSSGVFYEL